MIRILSNIWVYLFQKIFSNNKFSFDNDEIKNFIQEKIEAYKNILRKSESLPGIDGVKNFLEEASQLIKRFAICSGSSRQELEAALVKLEQGNIKDYFPIITTIEEVSEGKPSPQAYLITAKKLNIEPSKCQVIEDTPNGVMAAKNAGMKIIAITTSYQREAFGMADFVEDNYNNILNWLRNSLCVLSQA